MNLLQKFEARHPKREGLTLVVGSRIYASREDRRKRYANAVGVDQAAGEGVDVVWDLANEGLSAGPFDHVDCISVLEHCRKPWLVAHNVEELMAQKATMMLTVPFVWWVHSYPSDYWRMTTEAVRSIFPRIEWSELSYAHIKCDEISGKIPSIVEADHRYLARTEVFGFGAKTC